MARIPDGELERLKAEVSVARLVEGSGVKLAKRGADLVGVCPFHKDDTPSLVVTPDKNLFHCFGCGIGGGPVDWVMKKNGVSFRHAVELLREGVSGVTDGTVKHTTVRVLPAPVSLDADDQALLDQVVGYYHETLKRSPEALSYLQHRGLEHPELVERFKLGFADRTLGLRLPEKNRKAGAEIRARLTKIGIYRESGHEHLNGSLIVPILDEQGHATEVYGRKITEGLRAGTPLHLYLRGSHKGIWNIAGVAAAQGEVILTEALIDAMTFWCAGYQNVTAAYGVEGFTPDHLAAFKRYGVRRVLIAFDRDEAGERGTAKVAERLLAEGFDCFRVLFPKGLDANAYGLKLTPASKSLGLLIRKAEWLGNGAPATISTTPVCDVHPGALPAAKEGDVAVIVHPAAQSGDHPLAATVHPGAEPADTTPVEIAADLSSVALVQPVASPAAKENDGAGVVHLVASNASEPSPSLAAFPLPASVMPQAVTAEPEAEVGARDITINIGPRRYRVRGFARNLAVDVMKVNLLAAFGDAFHVDTFDLYSARHRANFIQMAAGELRVEAETIKTDLGRVLLKLESLQDERIRETLTPESGPREIAVGEHEAALAYLRAPDLLDRILADFEVCGLVGETTNKLVAYLAVVSRKLASPLAVLVQSSSAAGKTSLMDAVLALVPEEDRVRYSAMTGQSLFYMGQTSLKHRILAISEEEGAARASYALKLLQSEGEITIASTAKDQDTGNLVTQEYRVEGPVMIFLTTTAISIDEELMNRCLVLSVDEGREQTQAIHRLQRRKRTLEGLLARTARDDLLKLHRNVQRLLRPLAVVNPYADKLSFLSDKTRTRRDHEKYLTLIDTIALLHQHQRDVKRTANVDDDHALEYVEVTLADIEAANRLAHEVLGRSTDELPPQTRAVLASVKALVEERAAAPNAARAEVRFTRRELRESVGASDTQLKVHLGRLADLEYLIVHRAERGQGHVYELIYDGDGSAAPHLSGLIDVQTLGSFIYDNQRSAQNSQRSGSGRGAVGPWSGGGRGGRNGQNINGDLGLVASLPDTAQNARLETKKSAPSYTDATSYIDGSQTELRPVVASASLNGSRPRPQSSSLAASSLAARS